MTAEELSKATGIDTKYLLISEELREQVERAMHTCYNRGRLASYPSGPPWGEPNDFVKVEPGNNSQEEG